MASLVVFAAEVKMPDLLAIGDAKAGSELVALGASCHGANGES